MRKLQQRAEGCEIARAWLTPELVQNMAASFKVGGYRSASIYLELAKQRHLHQYGAPPSVYAKQCIKDYTKGTNRKGASCWRVSRRNGWRSAERTYPMPQAWT